MKHDARSSILILFAVLLVFVTACSNADKADKGTASSDNSGQSADAPAAKKPVKVVWWHSMGGELGKAVDKLVSDFNASHPDVQVEAVYQGSYDDSLNKFKATLGSNSGPTIIQVYEIGSRFMIDSKAIAPIQKFIDADHFDTSSWEDNITNYYTFNGQLYSMPFNTSNPILYYNKDMFKDAGLDPDHPPATYEEFVDDAQKLTKNGKYGASIAIYGWFMEQFFANQGALYVDNGNGRDKPAEHSLLAGDAGVKTLAWWKDMVDQKAALNLGRKTSDTKSAFVAGQVAMTFDSTASLRGIVSAVDNKFQVGTGFLPKPKDAAPGGVVVGGASNYILNDRPEEEQQGAWAFIKYLAAPEQQAFWNVNSGYFPVTKQAYDQDLVKQNMKQYPQFQTAVDQLHQTVKNQASQGAVMGVFPEARQIVEGAIESSLSGKAPKDALADAAKQIDEKLQQYNQTVSK